MRPFPPTPPNKAFDARALRTQPVVLLRTLKAWPWIDTLRTLHQRFREDRLGLTASSLTFTTTIALVPLLTVALAVFSAFPMFSTFRGALEKYFLQSLVPDSIARPVLMALTQFATKANRLGALGLVVLVFTALALMLTIDRTLNNLWRVRRPRPIAQRVLVYWAAATLGPLLLGVSLSITSYAISASQGWVGALPERVSLFFDALQFALLAAGMAGLFHYVPNTAVLWRHALSGGIFVAAGIEGAKKALAWYLGFVPTYTSIYGAFATVPIFLVWIYLVWVIVLLGAVVAAYAPSLQGRIVRRPEGPGFRFELSLEVLRELAQARADGRGGIATTSLAAALATDPLQIEPVLDSLFAVGWVARVDEPGDPRNVLLCDPASTSAEPLIADALLAPSPAVQTLWTRARLGAIGLHDLL